MPRRRRYRRWNAEEKRSICRQTRAPGVSVAQVARRHALNANLIFKWLKDPRFAAPAAIDLVSLPRWCGRVGKVHHAALAICSQAWAGVKKPSAEWRRRRL
jgi:Transposase